MQSGIGPFVGVFLQAHGWASGLIGTAMTLGNVAGMLITTPIGGFIDALVLASLIILVSQIWAVAASQIATSIAGVAIVPAVTGITLGMVKPRGFNRQNGRNQAFNHAGNMVGAAVSGYLGWRYGYTAVFLLAAVFGAISIVCVLMIPRQAIDNRAARGKEEDPESQPSGFTGLPCWSSTSRSSYSHLRLPPSISATRRSFPSMVWRRPSTARRTVPPSLRPRSPSLRLS